MPIDRKAKLYQIVCPECNDIRFVAYPQWWNIDVGNCTGKCKSCCEHNIKGLEQGKFWNKGKNFSGMSGKHQSEKQKEIMRQRKGSKMSEEAVEKMRLAKLGKRGEQTSNWKGGVSFINQGIRRSADYHIWRKQVFEKDNYTCQFCGQIGGELNADHIKEFSKYPELRMELSNGRTLCVDCHRQRHNIEEVTCLSR